MVDTPGSEPTENSAVSTASNSVLRLAYLHDLVISRKPKSVEFVEVPSLREIADPIAKLVEHKPIVFTYQRDQGCTALLDARIVESKYLVLLFGCGDDKLTLRDLINKQTGEHIALNVPSDHVNAFSAHLIVRLVPDGSNPYAYPCLIEKVLGVPKTNLMLLMNKLLRERMIEEVQNANKSIIKSWPHLDIVGRPSKFVKKKNEEASIRGFIFTKSVVEQKLPDDFPQVQYIEEKVYFKIQPIPYSNESQGLLQRVMSFARKKD